MNNPDEETAVAQFGKGDKYFGVCTLMVTMPGLPMFGHGQIEGFTEKYGMEFTKAYWNETPDGDLIARHERDIFPLMKKRYLFAEIENFLFYDVWDNGHVNENVFAYSNRFGTERAVVFYNNVYDQASGWIKQSCPYAVKTGSGEHDIRMETHSIGEALGLSPESGNFCIFREQRSGLWFIRSAADICNNGLYLHLNGFESQVMMDISQVTDDETGKYRILCETLNGRGVSDIDTALREIFLKELYQSFTALVTPEFLEAVRLLCMPAVQLKTQKLTAPKAAEVLAAAEPAARVWFETVDAFIEGNYGASAVVDRTCCGKKIPAEKMWKLLEKRLTGLFKTAATGQKKAADSFTVTMFEGMASRPACAQMLAGFTVLYSIKDVLGDKATAADTAALIARWGLERKLQDMLLNENIPVSDTYVPLRSILAALPYSDVIKAVKTPSEATVSSAAVKAAAGTIAQSVVYNPAAAVTAGVNEFNNVLWFNEERMTDTLWFAVVVPAVMNADVALYPLLETLLALFIAAQKKSEYRADVFAELLPAPAVKARKTASKKTGKKDPVKTGTEAKKSVSAGSKAQKESGNHGAGKKETGKRKSKK